MAPFNGYIVEEHSYLGQWLSKGDPVVTLALLDTVEVVAKIDQWDLKHVQVGAEANIRIQGIEHPLWSQSPVADLLPNWMVDTFSEHSDQWKGKIVSIVPQSRWKEGSRSFPVRIELKNWFRETNGLRIPVLQEGMMAEVTIHGKPVTALMVPKDSVVRTTRGNQLFVLDSQADEQQHSSVTQKQVETGLSEGDWIQVFVEGLKAGRFGRD